MKCEGIIIPTFVLLHLLWAEVGGVGGAGGHEGAELRGGAGVRGRRLARLQLRDQESSALRRGGHRRLVIQHLGTCQ